MFGGYYDNNYCNNDYVYDLSVTTYNLHSASMENCGNNDYYNYNTPYGGYGCGGYAPMYGFGGYNGGCGFGGFGGYNGGCGFGGGFGYEPFGYGIGGYGCGCGMYW